MVIFLLSFYRNTALGTDAQYMATAFTQHTVNALAEVFQHIHRHECLYSACKATAVNAEAAPVTQQLLAQAQAEGHILVGSVTGRDHILQIHIRGTTAFLDESQESIKIIILQSPYLLGNSVIFCIKALKMALLSGFGDIALLIFTRNAFLAHKNDLYRIFHTQPKKRYP